MELKIQPGRYVAAVSGGVDSVSLLRLLQDQPGVELVVAHFDHGIRPDSELDRHFVQALAEGYGVPFVFDEGRLGAGASEAAARQARYEFLHKVRQASGAGSVLTAHHRDDALETAIINLLRGSGRKGLSALGNQPGVERPLLHVSKADLREYAKREGLEWREDSTNRDEAYLRNYVRHQLLAQFDEDDRQKLTELIVGAGETNSEIDTLLVKYLRSQPTAGTLDRQWFNNLPHDMSREVMAAWLRAADLRDFDSKTLERLVVAAKTARPGSRFDVLNGRSMRVERDHLALAPAER